MAEEVAVQMGRVQLASDEEEEEEIVLSDAVVSKVVSSCLFSLVGRLLISKKFNKIAFKECLRKAWGMKEELRIVEVGENLFHFRFAEEEGMRRVLAGGPWNFDDHILLLKQWKEGMMEGDITFESFDVWVQLHGLPFEYIGDEVGRAIGGRIGELLEVDNRVEGGEQGRFIRIMVRLELNAPLKRGGNIVCGGGRKVWVAYKYERLLSFCFYCGRVDHEENSCQIKDNDGKEGRLREGRYGELMKAASAFRRRREQAMEYERTWNRGFGNFSHRNPVMASGGARSRDGYGKSREIGILAENKGDDWRDNQLVEIGDNSVINLNGKSHRVGDLFPSGSGVNKGSSCDLSKNGKENHGKQAISKIGPGSKPREQTGLQNFSPITTGLGKKQSSVIPRLDLAEGANKQTIGLGNGVQIEKEIVSQTTKTGLMTTQPIGECLGLDGIELMDIPISFGFNNGASSGSSTLIFSSELKDKGERRSTKVKRVKGNTTARGGRGQGRKRDTEKSLLVLGKRRTTDSG